MFAAIGELSQLRNLNLAVAYFLPAKFEWDPEYDTPAEVLGPHLEACDPLRTEFACYIRSVPHQQSLLVMGNDPKNVKTVLNRLRGAFFQAIARGKAHLTQSLYLLNPIQEEQVSARVIFESVWPGGQSVRDRWGRSSKALGVKACLEAGWIEDAGSTQYGQRTEKIPTENIKRFGKSVNKALATAKYFRGNLHMSATFGVFLLQRYKGDVHDFEALEAMMDEDQVEGGVDYESVSLEDIVLTKITASTLLTDPSNPTNISVTPKPMYGAALLVKHKDVADLRLDVEFMHEQHTGDVSCPTRRWSRFIYGPQQNVKLLDVSLVDLQRYDTDQSNYSFNTNCIVNPTLGPSTSRQWSLSTLARLPSLWNLLTVWTSTSIRHSPRKRISRSLASSNSRPAPA